MAKNLNLESYDIKRIESVLGQHIIPEYKRIVREVNNLVDDLKKLEQAIHGNNPEKGLTKKYIKMGGRIDKLWDALKNSYLQTLSDIYNSAVSMAGDVNEGDFDNMASSFASSVFAGMATQASLISLKKLETKSFVANTGFPQFAVSFVKAPNCINNIGTDLLSIDSVARDLAVGNSSLKSCFSNSKYSENIDEIDSALQTFLKGFSKTFDNFTVVVKKKVNWYTEHMTMSDAKLNNYKSFLNEMSNSNVRYVTQGVVPTAAGIATGSYATLSKDADGNENINTGVSMSSPYASTGGTVNGSVLTNDKSNDSLNSYNDVVKAQKNLNKSKGNGSSGNEVGGGHTETGNKGDGNSGLDYKEVETLNNFSDEASYQMSKKAAWESGKVAERNAMNAAAASNAQKGDKKVAWNNAIAGEQAARNAAAESNTEIGNARLNIEYAQNNTANAKAGEQAAQAAKIAAERNNTSINNSKYGVSDTYMQAAGADNIANSFGPKKPSWGLPIIDELHNYRDYLESKNGHF